MVITLVVVMKTILLMGSDNDDDYNCTDVDEETFFFSPFIITIIFSMGTMPEIWKTELVDYIHSSTSLVLYLIESRMMRGKFDFCEI